MRILVFGTYDLGKPRTRILLAGLRVNGASLTECHVDVWSGVEDKSQIKGTGTLLLRALRWIAAYPILIAKYLIAPRHDVVLVPYMGHLDVLVLKPFAWLRRAPIIWDAFLSLWDTVVADRRMVSEGDILARGLRRLEAWACRAADVVVLDTEAHARFFCETYSLPSAKTAAVFVGAEAERFPWQPPRVRDANAPIRVLFYGQFIPLHGIPTIVEAARLARDKPIDWVLIGSGQEEERVRLLIQSGPSLRVTWIPWMPYESLIKEIARADICLGIFGDSAKAGRVIPNKVFQILSSGRPLVTRDSPAMRELMPDEETPGIVLVPPAAPAAVVAAVERLANAAAQPPYDLPLRFSATAIGAQMSGIFDACKRAGEVRESPARSASP